MAAPLALSVIPVFFSVIEVCLINRSLLKGAPYAWSLYSMLHSVSDELCCF